MEKILLASDFQQRVRNKIPALHFKHKVGALGGGNDIESGQYTLEEAYVRCSMVPAAVGFTYQGKPSQQGKLMCYFKSSPAANDDPNWQTYFKSPGTPAFGARSTGPLPWHASGHVWHASPAPAPLLVPEARAAGVDVFEAPVPDFSLTRVRATTGTDAVRIALTGPAIVLSTAGAPRVGGGAEGAESARTLAPGQALFVTPDERSVLVDGAGEIFLAQPGALIGS